MKNLFTTVVFFLIASFTIAQGSIDSGLVAFYPFNENANDLSGNGNHGTVNGALLTIDRFGNSNSSYQFNGTSDFISVADDAPLDLTNEITLSAWVKRTRYGIDMILEKGGDWTHGFCNYGMSLHSMNNNMFYFFFNGGWRGTDGVNDFDWHHYAVVAQHGSANPLLYIDGQLKSVQYSEGASTINLTTSALDLHIGAQVGTATYYGANIIDEIRIYNRALTQDEILILAGDGLIAYFPFNGNAIDETGNGYNGTLNGNATVVADRFNSPDRAYTFPDQSSNIALNNSTNLNLENGFTINAWIKYKSGRQRVIIDKHVCGYPNGFVFLIDWDNQIAIYLASSGWSTVRTNDTFTEDQWYMVTATFNESAGIAKVYVDGEVGGSGSVTTYNNFNPYPITIGESYQNNCQPGNMDGAVDEVKIYNRPLSDAEILDEYNNTYNDLVLFLPFNGNANDESGNNNNGTVSGASLTQDRFGINNKAYSFNGTDNYITIADNPNLFSDELTISWWYKMTEILGGERVVIGWVDGGHRYQQFFNGGQLSYLNGYNVAQPGMYFNPIYGLNDLNVWKNVVVTYQKTGASTSTTSIYVDGDLKQTDNHTLAMDYVPGIDLSIGKNHNGNFFKGYFDDLRIFNRNLSAAEILALYHDSTTYNPPLEDGLVAYWPFDGNADDSTSNNNDGINYNGVFSKDRYGNDNTSMFFNAVDSYVEGINPGNNLPVGNSPRTFSAWIRNNQYNQYGCNIFHYGAAQAAPTNFHFLITDVLGLGNGYGYGVVYGNSNLIDSTWHFVTGVYEGGTERTTKLYVDGRIDASGVITTEPNTVLSTNWRIGRFMEGSSNFKGNIDELKVYDIPLTNQQVWNMYKATTTAPILLFPNNNSTLVNNLNPILDWDSTITATNYLLIMANDSLLVSTFLDTLIDISTFYVSDGLLPNIDNIYWKVRTINDGGIGPWSELNRFQIVLTDVEDETQLPTEFALLQNYPNPFNPSTTITYHLPHTARVELKIYDVLGNEISTLVDEEKSAGSYEVEFNSARYSREGGNLTSGIYFYQFKAGDFVQIRKMILIK